MPLPTKSRYTITEAAKFIKCATGEAVTQAQILDWGTHGLYRLHLAIEHCNIRPIGETEIIQVRDSITELRLSSGQAAILGRVERVGISACWHNGVECNFVRARTGDYSGWTPDTVYFGATALVLLGSELASFTAKFAEPLHNAPAPAPDTATLLPVVAVSASGCVESDKAGPVDRGWVTKKAALIKKYIGQWPTVKSDFHSASENGLSNAAKAPEHGNWFEAAALNWARQRGKLTEDTQQGPATLSTVWTGKTHTIGE